MGNTHWGITAYDGPITRRIRKVINGNPKRGAAAVRFNQYRSGMTVGEFIAACEKLEVPNYAVFDITWGDPKRKFIELYD
jgi:hypothetical protein